MFWFGLERTKLELVSFSNFKFIILRNWNPKPKSFTTPSPPPQSIAIVTPRHEASCKTKILRPMLPWNKSKLFLKLSQYLSFLVLRLALDYVLFYNWSLNINVTKRVLTIMHPIHGTFGLWSPIFKLM